MQSKGGNMKGKKQTSLVTASGYIVRLEGHTERKDLIRKMRKVLLNERAHRLSVIRIKPRDVDGGHFGSATIVCGSFKTFLHELAHAQTPTYCSHKYGSCSCSHNIPFHRAAFTLYGKYLRGEDAVNAREGEYRYHANTAGKVAGEFRKRSEFLRWKRERRDANKEVRATITETDEDVARKDAAMKHNLHEAKWALERLQELTQERYTIRWYGKNSMYHYRHVDANQAVEEGWRRSGKGIKAYVYRDGTIRNLSKKVLMNLEEAV
jgi:hypothetical protein